MSEHKGTRGTVRVGDGPSIPVRSWAFGRPSVTLVLDGKVIPLANVTEGRTTTGRRITATSAKPSPPPPHPDEPSWWGGLEAANGDARWAGMCAFADWLQERQDRPDLQHALRWAAKWRRWPANPVSSLRVWWGAAVSRGDILVPATVPDEEESAFIPASMVVSFPRYDFGNDDRPYVEAPTLPEAFAALAEMLRALRDTIEV